MFHLPDLLAISMASDIFMLFVSSREPGFKSEGMCTVHNTEIQMQVKPAVFHSLRSAGHAFYSKIS